MNQHKIAIDAKKQIILKNHKINYDLLKGMFISLFGVLMIIVINFVI